MKQTGFSLQVVGPNAKHFSGGPPLWDPLLTRMSSNSEVPRSSITSNCCGMWNLIPIGPRGMKGGLSGGNAVRTTLSSQWLFMAIPRQSEVLAVAVSAHLHYWSPDSFSPISLPAFSWIWWQLSSAGCELAVPNMHTVPLKARFSAG